MPFNRQQPLLLDRLSKRVEEITDFDHNALAESVRLELSRLINTRRPMQTLSRALTVLDYGIGEFGALQAPRADELRQLMRDLRVAVQNFEPRFQLSEISLEVQPQQPQCLIIRMVGQLRSGPRSRPTRFIIESANNGLEVRHGRLD